MVIEMWRKKKPIEINELPSNDEKHFACQNVSFSILFRSVRPHRLNFLFLFIACPIGIIFIVANIITKIIVALTRIGYPSTCNA